MKKWQERNSWLESIRRAEINIFSPLVDNTDLYYLDLGCGKDKYLKHALKLDKYVGVDPDGGDLMISAMYLVSSYANFYILSFGLLYLLPYRDQRIMLQNIKQGVLQVNRIDTKDGEKLIDGDLKEGLKIYPWKELPEYIKGVYDVYDTPVSFILKRKTHV